MNVVWSFCNYLAIAIQEAAIPSYGSLKYSYVARLNLHASGT